MEKTIEKILNQTKKLISEEKYDEALAILKEEIANPLNSLADQNILQDKHDQLSKFVKQNQWLIKLHSSSKSDLIKMFNAEGYEPLVLDILLEKYGKHLSIADMYRLQQVFLDDGIDNVSKIGYLNRFKDYEINFKFQFHNVYTDKTFEVDTSKDFDIYVFEDLFKVSDKLSALYFKETSKDNLAKGLIDHIYCYYFNDYSALPYKGDDLFNHLVNYIEHAFNAIYPSNDEFSKWINSLEK